MKKLISLALVIVMAVSVIGVVPAGAEEFEYDTKNTAYYMGNCAGSEAQMHAPDAVKVMTEEELNSQWNEGLGYDKSFFESNFLLFVNWIEPCLGLFHKVSAVNNGETEINIELTELPQENGMDYADVITPYCAVLELPKSLADKECTVTEHELTRIYNAEQLKAFADSVNSGNTYENSYVELLSDIDLSGICGRDINGEEVSWTPVGADDSFNGTFDGNGHTISGLYINSENGSFTGLFGFCGESSQILNLVVDGSVKFGYPSVGGWANPPIEMGGIAGVSAGKIANCHNKADITGIGNGAIAAGICGMGFSAVIENCINTGVIISEYESAAIVAWIGSSTTDNCYYLEGTSVDGSGAQAKTAEQFASGEVTYLLNGSISEGDISWYQNIGEDDFPVLDNTHSAVLFDGEKYYNNEPIPSNKINAYLSKYWLGDNDYKAPRIFMTYEELEAYAIENNLDKYNRLLELYPRSLFEDKFLYARYIEGGSGSNQYTVNTSEEANSINIEITRIQEGMTTDYFKYCLYAEIDKSLVSKDINVTFFENRQTTTYPYEISGLRITNTAGEEIEQVQKNTSFIVEADITKTEERNEKDYLFAAVYDTDGALISLDYVRTNFNLNGESSFGFYVPAKEKAPGSVKAFVWDAFGSAQPLSEAKTLSFMK